MTFLEVTKAIYTVWIDGLLYKLTVLKNLVPCKNLLVLPACPDDRRVLPNSRIHLLWCAGCPGTGCTIFSRTIESVNERPEPAHHVDLVIYVYDTAIITMSGKPALIFTYLDSYLTYLERWPREEIVINA